MARGVGCGVPPGAAVARTWPTDSSTFSVRGRCGDLAARWEEVSEKESRRSAFPHYSGSAPCPQFHNSYGDYDKHTQGEEEDFRSPEARLNILAVDIGTGTEDVLYLNTRLAPENAFRIVAPAPTLAIGEKIRECTRRGEAILLTGRIMGGGPSQWAAEAHVRGGYRVYATAQAARTFDDDLDRVQGEMGVEIVSEEEAASLPARVRRIELGDFNYQALQRSFAAVGVDFRPQAVLVAAFDHGQAPHGVSDRRFRFEQLQGRLGASGHLSSLAFAEGDVPASLTRLRAIEEEARGIAPHLMLMDSGGAAALGALLDPLVADRSRPLVVNVGNFHVLGFRLRREEGEESFRIEGLFEHHTGFLDRVALEGLLGELASGQLTNEEIFESQGHGALLYSRTPYFLDEGQNAVVVVGPRRDMMRGSRLRPYFAAPYGDMMMAGDYGLIRAAADRFADLRAEILHSLGDPIATAPWDIAQE